MERSFSHDVSGTIFLNLNKKMAAILVDQNISSRIVFNFYLFHFPLFSQPKVDCLRRCLFTLKGRRNKDIVGLTMKGLIYNETVVSRRISNELIKFKFPL